MEPKGGMKKMEEVRKLNLMFNKGGSGSETARLAVPTTWIKEMGLNKDEKAVIAIAKKNGILIRKASEEGKFLVINKQDDINEYVKEFNDLQAANETADTLWQHYTSAEKKKAHVYVGYVTEEMLAPYAFDEDGDVEDWTAYWDIDSKEEFFDSQNL